LSETTDELAECVEGKKRRAKHRSRSSSSSLISFYIVFKRPWSSTTEEQQVSEFPCTEHGDGRKRTRL